MTVLKCYIECEPHKSKHFDEFCKHCGDKGFIECPEITNILDSVSEFISAWIENEAIISHNIELIKDKLLRLEDANYAFKTKFTKEND